MIIQVYVYRSLTSISRQIECDATCARRGPKLHCTFICTAFISLPYLFVGTCPTYHQVNNPQPLIFCLAQPSAHTGIQFQPHFLWCIWYHFIVQSQTSPWHSDVCTFLLPVSMMISATSQHFWHFFLVAHKIHLVPCLQSIVVQMFLRCWTNGVHNLVYMYLHVYSLYTVCTHHVAMQIVKKIYLHYKNNIVSVM